MSRIQLQDSPISAIVKMSDGNPGATVVMGECLKRGAEIDPDSFLGGLGSVLALDTHKIYGPQIWMFYKDVCGQDLRIMLALLRAVQLGYLREERLRAVIDGSRRSEPDIDIAALVSRVEEALPNFQRAPQGIGESV